MNTCALMKLLSRQKENKGQLKNGALTYVTIL